MHELFASRKVLWAFLGIAILAIAVTLVAILVAGPQSQPVAVQDKSAPQFQSQEVPSGQLPRRFPADLPIEPNAPVIDNFNSTASDGTFQATRSYASSYSPTDNYKTFTAFFKKAEWTTLAAVDTTAQKSLTVQKGDTTIQVLSYTTVDSAKISVVKINVTMSAQANQPPAQ